MDLLLLLHSLRWKRSTTMWCRYHAARLEHASKTFLSQHYCCATMRWHFSLKNRL